MTTALAYSPRFLQHDTGPGHPERPRRLQAICEALQDAGLWSQLTHLDFEPVSPEILYTLHEPDYVTRLQHACQGGAEHIDTPDSAICGETYDIARLAVGAVIAAAEAVVRREVHNAFAFVRPPGHHAERNRSMGFCMFGNIALAAEHLIRHHGLERVAIVDFDVHHGNGTQHMFEDRGDVLFLSIHEHPWSLYPGSGFETETGTGSGAGKTLNVPVFPQAGDAVYQTAFRRQVLPALDAYEPQAILVSAGFDAAAEDPLAHTEVSTEGFAWMTRQLVDAAARHAEGRLLCVLEGGYHLRSLGDAVVACVRELMTAGDR